MKTYGTKRATTKWDERAQSSISGFHSGSYIPQAAQAPFMWLLYIPYWFNSMSALAGSERSFQIMSYISQEL
jgi:hypothetical protein